MKDNKTVQEIDDKQTSKSTFANLFFLPEDLKNITENKIKISKKTDSSPYYLKSDTKDKNEVVKNFNNQFRKEKFDKKLELIYKVLEKENDMAEPRNKMQTRIIIFLACQLIFLALLIAGLFVAKGYFGSFSDKLFVEILTFLKFYITAIIGEFIAMIFFIVKYLFNNKLIDVIKNWVDKL